MGALKTRLAALERMVGPNRCPRWHCIVQDVDQTPEQARAAFEAENGPIGPEDGQIVRVIVH